MAQTPKQKDDGGTPITREINPQNWEYTIKWMPNFYKW
jgi:hypothetical protein